MVDPSDLAPADRDRALGAAAALELRPVTGGADLRTAYAALDAYFGPRGELEPRAVLARFAAQGPPAPAGVSASYHLVAAWEGRELAGVRDCYVDVDPAGERCLVSLAHVWVAPAWRRRGLAGLFRALPVTLGRRRCGEVLGREVPTLVVAEMEPADPADPETVARLVAYGRSAFGVLDPARLPYSQPVLSEGGAGALPLLGVVRTRGLPPGEVPVALAAWFPEMFHLTHASYLPRARVEPSRTHALGTLHRSADPVRILPLPTDPADLSALGPLVRSAVLAHYPPGLHDRPPGDAAAERAALAHWKVTGQVPRS